MELVLWEFSASTKMLLNYKAACDLLVLFLNYFIFFIPCTTARCFLLPVAPDINKVKHSLAITSYLTINSISPQMWVS